MATKKRIEAFNAGCSTCKETIELGRRLAGASHEVVIHDMHLSEVASRAKHYGVRTFEDADICQWRSSGNG